MWRKEPPTVEEVKNGARFEYGCQYWWNRTPGSQPRIIAFDYDPDREALVICDFERGFPGTDDFNPNDWGEEWAMCVPPPDGPTPDMMSPNEPPQPHSCGPGCFYHFGG